MKEKLLWIPVLLVVIGVVGGTITYFSGDLRGYLPEDIPNPVPPAAPQQITNFEECAAAGNPVMESYPRQCNTPDGKHFVEDIGNELEKQDLIRISSPRPNQTITSPLQVEGEARGFWFFEASFPVSLLDANGNEIPLDPPFIMATEEWMTEEFVPFEATLEFEAPAGQKGILVFHRDNPSDLPENADELRMPIRFAEPEEQPGESRAKDGCVITGCSGQVCSDEQQVTTCEFRPEYACYRQATCERQASGECGWTQTAELSACLQNPE